MSKKHTPRAVQELPKCLPVSKYVQSGISSRVKESATELNNFQQNWDRLHLSGLAILSSIKILKMESMKNNGSRQTYPKGLQERCDHLQDVVDKMESSLANLQILVQQFNALVQLHSLQGDCNSIVNLTWSIEKFRQAFQDIHDTYSKEFKLKKVVKEEIAHCSRKEDLIYHITCWTLQPFIGSSFNLLCESLYREINSK